MDFAVPADHRVKLKENEKRDKYLDFTGKKLRNMKETVIPIGTVTKRLIQGLANWKISVPIETIQTTALL